MDKCSCSWFGTFNIVKISTLPNLINRFSTIPFKIPINYFVDVNKQILQLMWKATRSRIASWVLKKEKNWTQDSISKRINIWINGNE